MSYHAQFATIYPGYMPRHRIIVRPCHCLPLPATACHCLPLPATAAHCLWHDPLYLPSLPLFSDTSNHIYLPHKHIETEFYQF